MMKRLLIALVALVTGIVLAVPAQAATSFTDTTPYTGQSPDSGTCGTPHWAHDAFTRNFSAVGSGTSWTVTEKFKQATFSTLAGESPGACNTPTPTGGMVNEGVHGRFNGFLKFPVTGSLVIGGTCVRNPDDGMCHTAGWLDGFFPSGHVDGDVTAFKFTYTATGQGLTMFQWINADPTNGGNSGDIAN